MIKMAIIISAISILALVLMFSGRIITVEHVESNDRDVDSFSTVALWMAVASGCLMVIVAWWTFKLHIIAGIIPFGVGAGLIVYCGYLLWCKSLAGF